MFRKLEDFYASWKHEHESTVKLFERLTDASLSQSVTADGRSLGFIAWHLVQTLGEMPARTGLTVDAPAEDAPVPASASEIVSAFITASDSLVGQLRANWTDETLLQEDDMYGEQWTRGVTLLCLELHHAHHRGQMTVLMRQAGLQPNGVYGPAKEEWSAFGMPPMP
ncbi:MAG: hypothetical protein AMXMBFR82_37400 [Candidatus Hydrogenedentota bacterium]